MELCRPLDIRHLKRVGLLYQREAKGKIRWFIPASGFEKTFGEICYKLETDKNGAKRLLLEYLPGDFQPPIRHAVQLQTTRPPYGGCRWWFTCPGTQEKPCGRRVGVLYFHPVSKLLGCRHCFGLLYFSAKFPKGNVNRLLRQLGGPDPYGLRYVPRHSNSKDDVQPKQSAPATPGQDVHSGEPRELECSGHMTGTASSELQEDQPTAEPAEHNRSRGRPTI